MDIFNMLRRRPNKLYQWGWGQKRKKKCKMANQKDNDFIRTILEQLVKD